MQKTSETKEMKMYKDILLQSTMLDFKMTNLESKINCKTKEIEVLERTLSEDNKDIQRLQQQISALEEKEARLKRNIEAHRLTKSTMEGLKVSLAEQLKSMTEKNAKMKETHDSILSQFEKKWERYEATYNKLPWVRDRNQLVIEVKLNTILINIAKKKMFDEIEKAKLFKQITYQRYIKAVVKFAESMVLREKELRKIEEQENKNIKLEKEIEELRLKLNEVSQQHASRTKSAVANAKERAERLQAKMGLLTMTGRRPTEFIHSENSTPIAKYPIPQRMVLSTPSTIGMWSSQGTGTCREGEGPFLRYASSFGISKPPESLMKLLARKNAGPGGRETPSSPSRAPDTSEVSRPAEQTPAKAPETEAITTPRDGPKPESDVPEKPVGQLEKPEEGPTPTGTLVQVEPKPEQPQQETVAKDKPQEETPSNRPTVQVPRENLTTGSSGGKSSTPRPVLLRKNITLANAQSTRFFRPTIDLSEPDPKRPKKSPLQQPALPPPPFKEPAVTPPRPNAEPAKHVKFADLNEEETRKADEATEKPEPETEKIKDDPPVLKETIQETHKDVCKEDEVQSCSTNEPISSQSSNHTSLMMSPIPGINDPGRQAFLTNLESLYNPPEHLKDKHVKTPTTRYLSDMNSDIESTQSQDDKSNKIISSPMYKYTNEFSKNDLPSPVSKILPPSPVFGGIGAFQGSSAGTSSFGSLFFGSSKESEKKSKPSSSTDFFNLNF